MNNSESSRRPPCEKTLVSVVLPVFNEAEVLSLLAARIAKVLRPCVHDYELIFVDDGSRDHSPQVLDQLAAASDQIRVIHFSRNFGHQSAVQAGLVHARGDVIVLMDSDMQDAPEAIPRLLALWHEGYDVVYAIRSDRKENWFKRTLFAAFHRLMAAVSTPPIPAEAGNFGAIDRCVARQIVALGERDRYFPGLRSWVGFRQTGVVVERNARYDGQPRVSLRGLFRLAKTAIFSFSSCPLAIFHVIGVAAAVVFLGLGGLMVLGRMFTGLAMSGWMSYALTSSFFVALNALGISILGEYLVRIYDQVRNRPTYIVDRLVNFRPRLIEDETPEEVLPGDEPYVELMDEAARLLDEFAVREAPARRFEEQPEDFEEAADPEWLRTYR